MNLKLATALIALSLPLVGCGNKGPLVLPQSPPAEEAESLPIVPPMGDASLPSDAVPEDGAPPAPPVDDANKVDVSEDGVDAPPPAAASDHGNG